jgi:hypothetical protein
MGKYSLRDGEIASPRLAAVKKGGKLPYVRLGSMARSQSEVYL